MKYLIATFLIAVFSSSIAQEPPFNINSPNKIVVLPAALHEISGLAWYNSTTLAAVEDENGVVYFINATTGKVTKHLRFARMGDYEGIEIVNENIYVMSSNGYIYCFPIDDPKQVTIISTPLKSVNDVEGLCYSPKDDKLLIACKGKAGIGKKDIKGRAIYAFDYYSYQLEPNSKFNIKKSELEPYIGHKPKAFKPSGIAVDPISGNLYLLASVGKLLVIISPDGKVLNAVELNEKIYSQPEGICFSSKGDLYISNEGRSGKPKLLIFERL